MRKLLLSTCILAALGSSPAMARTYVDLDINVGPPPVRYEVVPDPRPGYFWVPGYWYWERGDHVWVEGRWEHERPGYYWEPERWEQHGNKWHFNHGHWGHGRGHGHDRDHDHDEGRWHH